jgi:hypothetical protein
MAFHKGRWPRTALVAMVTCMFTCGRVADTAKTTDSGIADASNCAAPDQPCGLISLSPAQQISACTFQFEVGADDLVVAIDVMIGCMHYAYGSDSWNVVASPVLLNDAGELITTLTLTCLRDLCDLVQGNGDAHIYIYTSGCTAPG